MPSFLVQDLTAQYHEVQLPCSGRVADLYEMVQRESSMMSGSFLLRTSEGFLLNETKSTLCSIFGSLSSEFSDDDMGSEENLEVHFLEMTLSVSGGIDFQHREGGKTGSGGQLSEAQAALERKERLRKLALETIDISKDPYFMRNHLGTFECKLCLTLHPNEGNYLAHTQGKRHQYNLGRRAAMEAKTQGAGRVLTSAMTATIEPVQKKRVMQIGRPGYKVTKARDLRTRQRSLLFEIDYPEAESGTQPRHRFMSAYEQKVEAPDKNYQYLLCACAPYETVAFKIPNQPIDKREGRFFTHWDAESKHFALQLFFVDSNDSA